MVGITGEERQHGRGFGIHHLFATRIDFPPGIGFLERRTGAGAVADIRHGNLHGVFVHGRLMPQNFGADNGILREIFRRPAADHQQTRGPGLNFDHRQFQKILDRINRQMMIGPFNLVHDQTETGGTVRKRRTENRHMIFVSRLDQRIFLFGMLHQIFAHFRDKFPRRIRTRLQRIGYFFDGAVAMLQVVFADERIINPVDIKTPQ